MSEQNHTLLDHVQEFVLLAWCVLFGFVLGRLLVQVLKPKPTPISQEEFDARQQAWRDQLEAHENEQRHLLAVEIAKHLEHLRVQQVTDDDMLRVPRG